ncbi:phosphatidylserine decarboxylase-domain-containing protein [Endogone sp. FLAS-F59071]|nr:phosphatidylserine decarboxylase-domain-containing protein [Endogone sp. FLAS-F59071]|eukprot:RUS21554.1 phosphatidylserine decarboxylase-domain-containing protein [Endogone sp. FLAS-F59071]
MSANHQLNQLVLRVQIIKAKDLAAKDRNGLSDPFAVVTLGDESIKTEVIPKTLNPVWQASFDMAITQARLASGGILIVLILALTFVASDIWDKDRFGKDFIGKVYWKWNIIFLQHNTGSAGAPDKLTVGFDDPDNKPQWYLLEDNDDPKAEKKQSRLSIIKGGASEQPSEVTGAVLVKFGLVDPNANARQRTPTEWNRLWKDFLGHTRASGFETIDIVLSDDDYEKYVEIEKIQPKPDYEQQGPHSLQEGEHGHLHGPDTYGVLFVELTSASNLPYVPSVTRVTFDMDPFAVVTFSRSTFRTSVIRHNLNPTWKEKLLLHIRTSELAFPVRFSIYDSDRITGNDLVASIDIPVQDLITQSQRDDVRAGEAEKRERKAGTVVDQREEDTIEAEMEKHQIELTIAPEAKVNPVAGGELPRPTLIYYAKFLSYPDLRRRFWRALCRAYDADENGMIGRMELRTMLDSIGSTLRKETVDKFWEKYGRDPEAKSGDELSFEEVADCFEEWLLTNEQQRLERKEMRMRQKASDTYKGKTGAAAVAPEDEDSDDDWAMDDVAVIGDDEYVLSELLAVHGLDGANPTSTPSTSTKSVKSMPERERLLNFTTCPVCHSANLPSNTVDLLTHVAMCASRDWTALDKLVMGGFVTEAYAQRKWFVKLVNMIGYGKYKPGENNANILVVDRKTGRVIEEKMPVYLRLGMRLLYQGVNTGVESSSAQRILTFLTVKQGQKYNDPGSAAQIPGFIAFHNLDTAEILEPLDSFKNFNEFFYRKLKPDARPCTEPNNPKACVSPADCRMMAFESITEATKIWIKGQDFGLKRLLGDVKLASKYNGGKLAIFRLAPQDYHRFHIPVDGVIGKPKHIDGQYYTVNPMAIRTTLDVYGENTRTILTIDSPQFGSVTIVCIGAMMVGSIIITAPPAGSKVKRMDEMGYFAFGGSTIVVLWQKDAIQFDEDLMENAGNSIETLVRAGSRVGVAK